MSVNVQNKSPYLRTSRTFPTDAQALSVEMSKSYVDIANNVNVRTIGIFAPASTVTGNSWFLQGPNSRQQTLRQIYTFVTANLPNIAHGINFGNISGFVAIYGTFIDVTAPPGVWYPLPYVDATAANNQVALSVDGTNIVIKVGGGTPPTVSSGFVVLEWLSKV